MSIPQQPAATAAPAPISAPVETSNDDAIKNYAAGFLQDLETNTDPDQNAFEEAPAEEAQPVVEAQEQPGAETPSPEVPMVEIDVEGEKFLVPEKVKHRVMADKDYRQKTMEVAATKKQLEQLSATATHLAQQAQQLAPFHAQLFQMDNRANALQQALQSPQLAADPLEYNRVQGELAVLLHNRTQFANGLQHHQAQFDSQQQQLRAHQLALEAPKLFEEYPELQKPEAREKLVKFVQESGLPQEAVLFLNYSAAGTKLVWEAHQYRVMVAEQAKSRAKLAEKTKTLPAATSSRAPDRVAHDKQLREQWRKDGGSINDPAFSQMLRGRLTGR